MSDNMTTREKIQQIASLMFPYVEVVDIDNLFLSEENKALLRDRTAEARLRMENRRTRAAEQVLGKLPEYKIDEIWALLNDPLYKEVADLRLRMSKLLGRELEESMGMQKLVQQFVSAVWADPGQALRAHNLSPREE